MSNPAARKGDSLAHGGSISTGSCDVFVNGIAAAYVGGSVADCDQHAAAQAVVVGSGSVFINGAAAALVSGKTSCGSAIVTGSGDVFIGS
ncbi:PAAR domain-containing protein [Paraburkholderia aspalathi]|uniref:PAAR domain-containing protein n=1 Tax=Paraburkholderia aspalathi TaxID=1324617 RepID=UPI0038BD4B32